MATSNTTTIAVTYKRSSASPELWVPYVLIGTTCVVFLAVHFWCYHKRNRIRYLRKREEWRVKSGLLERRRITTLMVARYQSELGITPSTSSGNVTSCRPWAFDSCGNGSSSPGYSEALIPGNDMVEVVVEGQSSSSKSNLTRALTPGTHSIAVATTKASAVPVAGHVLGQLIANYGGSADPCIDQNRLYSHLSEPEDILVQRSDLSESESKCVAPRGKLEGTSNIAQYIGREDKTLPITANTSLFKIELSSICQLNDKESQDETMKNDGENKGSLISSDTQTKHVGSSDSLINTQDKVRHAVQLVQPIREGTVDEERANGSNAFSNSKRMDRSQRGSESLPRRPLLSKCRQDTTLSEGGTPVCTDTHLNIEDIKERNYLLKDFSERTEHSITPEHDPLEKGNLKDKEHSDKLGSSERFSESVASNQVELSISQAVNQKASNYKPSISTSDVQQALKTSSTDTEGHEKGVASSHQADPASSQRSSTMPAASQMAETSFTHLKSHNTAIAWASQDSFEPTPSSATALPSTTAPAPTHASKEHKQYEEPLKYSPASSNDSKSTTLKAGGADPKLIFQCKRSRESKSDSTDL